MFLGTFQLRLDDKGRLSIPARYREILHQQHHAAPQQTDPEIILSSIGPRISAYPRSEWERIADVLAEATTLPGLHQDARDLYHVLFGNAAECTIDSQGRVLIPPHLRTKVGLNGEVTVVGLHRHFDILSRHTWDAYQATLHRREEEIAQKIFDIHETRLISRSPLLGDGPQPRL